MPNHCDSLEIYLDENSLLHVLVILLDNASENLASIVRKQTQEPAVITLRIDKGTGENGKQVLQVEVIDTGKGKERAARPDRNEAQPKRFSDAGENTDGQKLGLQFAAKIIEEFGGKLIKNAIEG